MLFKIILGIGVWLMLSLIVGIHVGHYLYKLNPDDDLFLEDDDEF